MPDRYPVHNERADHDCHDQAKACIELAADAFADTHVSNLYGPLRFDNGLVFSFTSNFLLPIPNPQPALKPKLLRFVKSTPQTQLAPNRE
jgi:hypothetical protein